MSPTSLTAKYAYLFKKIPTQKGSLLKLLSYPLKVNKTSNPLSTKGKDNSASIN